MWRSAPSLRPGAKSERRSRSNYAIMTCGGNDLRGRSRVERRTSLTGPWSCVRVQRLSYEYMRIRVYEYEHFRRCIVRSWTLQPASLHSYGEPISPPFPLNLDIEIRTRGAVRAAGMSVLFIHGCGARRTARDTIAPGRSCLLGCEPRIAVYQARDQGDDSKRRRLGIRVRIRGCCADHPLSPIYLCSCAC